MDGVVTAGEGLVFPEPPVYFTGEADRNTRDSVTVQAMTETDATPRLALEGVSLSYDGHTAVDDVSIDVGPGEIVCLLGPSGCGKSSTLRIAAGVERQDRGRVLVGGEVVSDGRTHLPPNLRTASAPIV